MSSTTFFDVLIVGAGLAGAQAALNLRREGFSGSIGLVGAEADPPYDRPPLSKAYLQGTKSFDQILLRRSDYWVSKGVSLHLGTEVASLSPARHAVACSGGEHFGYGVLIWAAGGSPRRLAVPGAELSGVHYLRSRADADALRDALRDAERLVVIGGGYIGLEAAASARKLGKSVTVLEAQPRLLARVAGGALSHHLAAMHRAEGVEIALNTKLAALAGLDGRFRGARLEDGTFIEADLCLVGVGIEPNVAPLLAAGATGGNGVKVDEFCRTCLPDIFAIGDCALHKNKFADGAFIRLESVQNAHDMAGTAARFIVDRATPYRAIPWFWSDQYGLKLQSAGLTTGYDEEIIRGDPETGRFTIIYRRAQRIIALDALSSPVDFLQGKALIEAGIIGTAANRLADPLEKLSIFAQQHDAPINL